MKKLIINILTTLLISTSATKVLDESIYKTESVLYTAKNDIVDIHCSIANSDIVFTVERKLPDGSFKGLYALKTDDNDDKNDIKLLSTKVLDNGQCTTSDNTTIYFGASDGIYIYNSVTNKADKYGNITADVRAIQKDTNIDVLYVIADNQLHRITERGTKIKKIESVNDAQEIVLDKENNLYFYDTLDSNAKLFEDKFSKPKVIVGDKIINVKGLPDKYNQIKLTRSFVATEGVLLLLDKRIYRLFPNGTSQATEYVFENAPTAYYFDLGIIQFFGHDRKLYQYNIVGLILQGLRSALSDFYNSIF